LTDAGSKAGTFLAGKMAKGTLPIAEEELLEVGDNLLLVAVSDDAHDDPRGLDLVRDMTAAGLVPFNRPPRRIAAEIEGTIQVPEAPQDPNKPPFNFAMMIAPLGVAAMMAAVTGRPQYALMALASPVMAFANIYETRHRDKRSLRKDTRRYEEAIGTFQQRLELRRASEAKRLRERAPHLAEVMRRAANPSEHLWERRTDHDDYLLVSLGYSNVDWEPPVDSQHQEIPREAAEVISTTSTLEGVPLTAGLRARDALGIIGDRAAALAVARAVICQIAVHQGPADVSIALLTHPGAAGEWDWMKWLPHTRDARGRNDQRLISVAGRPDGELALDTADVMNALADRFSSPSEKSGNSEIALVVLDDLDLFAGRDAPGRALLKDCHRVSAIVVAPTRDRLPAVCSSVLEVHGGGAATLTGSRIGDEVENFLASGVSDPTARRCARSLARFEDADLVVPGGTIPDECLLLPLLGLSDATADDIRDRWAKHPPGCAVPTPIGLATDGPITLDIVRNGPHALIGGTTGSGKSELLRSLVIGMASTAPPESLVFILLDFKGGETFSDFATLRHVVGTATDLDEHLAQRALRCLNAELSRREERRNALGIRDVKEQIERPVPEGLSPIPRLVVVIDEFGEMVGRLPDFLDSLDSIARRGRTLGVHLILATQKPAGVVSSYIASNVDLKIALRVQEPEDSREVIGLPDAAYILKSQPGRAMFRFGATQVLPVQTAYGGSAISQAETFAIETTRFLLGRNSRGAFRIRPTPTGPSEIDHLLSLISTASGEGQRPEPVWLDPLPAEVPLVDVPLTQVPQVAFGLVDDPERQRRLSLSWNLDDGNLLIYGIVGSGKTQCLRSLASSLALASPPSEVNLFGLDFGSGELQALEELPHTGAIVQAADPERQERLINFLDRELSQRRSMPRVESQNAARLVLLIDNFAALSAAYADQPMGDSLPEKLIRLFSDGPGVRIHTVITTDRIGSMPLALASLTQQKLALRLADPLDYAGLGLPTRDLPEFVPGRGITVIDGLEVQIAISPEIGSLVEHVRHSGSDPMSTAQKIATLPRELPLDVLTTIAGPAQCRSRPWHIPLGLTDATLEPAILRVFEGEHILIAGPPRSGRSSCLTALGQQVLGADHPPEVFAVSLRPSPLRGVPGIRIANGFDQGSTLLDAAISCAGNKPTVILIDDIELLGDLDGKVSQVISMRGPNLHLAFVARNDGLRSLFGHWTQEARKSRLGVLLRPDVDLDGGLLSTQLPRRQRRVERPGLGYVVVDGVASLVQFALPTPELHYGEADLDVSGRDLG